MCQYLKGSLLDISMPANFKLIIEKSGIYNVFPALAQFLELVKLLQKREVQFRQYLPYLQILPEEFACLKLTRIYKSNNITFNHFNISKWIL